MTSPKKDFDSSRFLNLLNEEELKNIGKELASQALNNVPIEYEEYQVKLAVPKTVIDLLTILTEIFPIDMEVILSKMASQGLSNILEGATQLPEEDKDIDVLGNVESISKLTDQLSDIQTLFGQFTNMGKSFEQKKKDI